MDILLIVVSVVALGITIRLWHGRRDYYSQLIVIMALLVVLYSLCVYFGFNAGAVITCLVGFICAAHYVVRILKTNIEW